ncbi:MAG TPA: hypothetical protein GXX33_04710 [Firmicutes bacterium]|nr:hypothetical protein [Bacillota bacterium]
MVGVGLWFVFLLVVPRRKWRDLYPTIVFTALLATITDLLGVTLGQWEYIGPTTGGLSLWSDLGIAPPQGGFAVYLSRRYPRWAWLNWFVWIGANAVGEWLFVQWGLIRYHQWNTLKASLFYIPFFALIFLQERWWRTEQAASKAAESAVGSGPKRIFTGRRD